MVAEMLLPLIPGIGAWPEHMVVRKARAAERPGKNRFLPGRWVEPESVRALDIHSQVLSCLCESL
ncbi:hypothetical protein LMG29542_07586 [Paraburkholderia humisilvae]|uniref:Uncharacterized protein n=1 Tax=Paraburkholderia humisilvae TaxID=627669 RepID=A0A6J5F9G6_9BURK|nr:hypothetical protein LMG29542_07586 [Paraburkholderia humisilvae]